MAARVALFGLRIRLRWILDEAWLLAVGARAEPFGTSASGVLDPDDGQTLRRLAARPPEILVAGLLLLISGCLALPRWWRLRAGSIRRERVDGSPSRTDNGWIAMYADGQGQGLPLWWQSGLALALMRGDVALSGRPLAGSDQPVDPVRLLLDTGADRPGLTGPWAGRGRLTTFLLNPGGWAAVAGSGEGETPRSGGEEVNES